MFMSHLLLIRGIMLIMIIIVRMMKGEPALIVRSNLEERKSTLFLDGMWHVLGDHRKGNRLVCLRFFRPSGWQVN